MFLSQGEGGFWKKIAPAAGSGFYPSDSPRRVGVCTLQHPWSETDYSRNSEFAEGHALRAAETMRYVRYFSIRSTYLWE